RLAGHGLALVAGVGAVALAFEAPYHAMSLLLPGAPPVESYFQQLVRFAQTQQGMGRPPLHLAYLAPFVFLAYLDLPALALGAYGVFAGKAWRDRSGALLVACLLAQLLSLGFVSPFARYLSWTLPALMILAAWGFVRLTEALRPRLGWAPAVVLALLVLVHTGWRSGPMLGTRGQMAAAVAFLQARPGAQVVTSDASVLLVYGVLAEQMPLGVPEVRDLLLRLMSRGPTFVVLDRQRFMDGATIMPPERYDRSAGAIIAHVGRPAWQTQQFRGLFVLYAFEHNFDILQTLRSVRGKTQGEKLAIYTADEALTVLEKH
ncbi:MAG: hypothetical protein KKI08_00530, partial [Armatimonadetes bacterium]|nr:hypothetical protein [Armatimonadota bacterium]